MDFNPGLKHQDINSRSKGVSPKLLLMGLLAVSLSLNAYFMFFEDRELSATQELEQTAEVTGDSAGVAIEEPPPSPAVETKKVSLPPETKSSFTTKQAKLATSLASAPGTRHVMKFELDQSLNYTLCKMLPKSECGLMSAYVSRILVWYLDVNRQLRKGDRFEIVYSLLDDDQRFQILRLVFHSQYLDKTIAVNYYKGNGMKYGNYFTEEGREMAPRIVKSQSPIRDYMEITSLTGDYRKGKLRGHSGTDFKTEVGTPVYASFEGKVLRINWNFRNNGDCVEIDHPDKGIKTMYLHLNKVEVKKGQWVKQGTKIGEAGNTGRSFAPHLHYEIRGRGKRKKIFNPFKLKHHKTHYSKIPKDKMADYQATVKSYLALQTG